MMNYIVALLMIIATISIAAMMVFGDWGGMDARLAAFVIMGPCMFYALFEVSEDWMAN